MAIIQPSLSPVLTRELTLASSMHSFIMQSLPTTVKVRDDRMNIFLAYYHLSDDLYGSILQLLSGGGAYDGGAFALVRPLVEACVMAQWLFFCASTKTVDRAHAGEQVSPGLASMMEAIDKVSGADFFAGMKGNVKVMHGFTHGGREQLGRRFDAEGNLRANYSDDEKKEVVRATTATFVLLTSIFHKVLLDDPTQDIQTAVLNEKFVELYGAAQTT